MKSLREINIKLKEKKGMSNRKESRNAMRTMVRKLILHKGKLCAKPDFDDAKVTLYPIPDSLQETAKEKYKEGDEISGKVGRLWYTKKRDRSGNRHVFVQYFMPTELLEKQDGQTA
jgi:hypothetical protein